MKKKIILLLTAIIAIVIIYYSLDIKKTINRKRLPEIIINSKGDSILILYDDNGIKISECEIKNNRRHGYQTTYYPNGQIRNRCYVSNEQPWAVGEFYSMKGDTLFPGTLFFGRGSFYEYYGNGTIKVKAFYKNSLRDSIWTYFDEDGNVSSIDTYSNGILLKTKTNH